MLIDNSLILDDNFALTSSVASTNYIDTIGAAGGMTQISGVNDIRGGYDAYWNQIFAQVLVRTAMAGGTSVVFALQTAPTNAFSGGLVTLIQTAAIPTATLVAKYVAMNTRIPQGMQRYLRGNYTVVGTFTSGNIDFKLVPDVQIDLT